MATNNMRWQAPGNGKIFDDELGSDSYMNQRTICVLRYIKGNPKISQIKFEQNIKDYLASCSNYDRNESLPSHFFRPLLFMGFIYQNDDSSLELTLEGEKFFDAYQNNKFDLCRTFILNQLDNIKYPNKATKNVNLQLFPFRILFKLLLEQNRNGISRDFIKKQLVYIKNIDDLNTYIKTKSIDSLQEHEPYDKFYTWVINSLVDIKILKKISDRYYIHDDLIEYINKLYHNLEYKDFFFKDDTLLCTIDNKTAKQRYKRDAKLINEAKNRDKFICKVDTNHKTFNSKGKNYVEGHHIIPMFQQKNYSFKLDDVNNIISLCPNCHREIHLSDDKKNIIDRVFNIHEKYLMSKKVSKEDLYKMYMCVV